MGYFGFLCSSRSSPSADHLRLSPFFFPLTKDEGWWQGSCNGQYGLFPANYVELLE